MIKKNNNLKSLIYNLQFTIFVFVVFISSLVFAGVSDKPVYPHLNSDEIKKIQSVSVNNNNFSFVVMGDNRDGDSVFDFFVSFTNKLQPSFVIDVGDFVSHGFEKEYSFFLQQIEKSKIPFLVVTGNHEFRVPEGRSLYQKIFGEFDYFFDYGDTRFIILDNAGGKLTKEQLTWFEDKLKTDKKLKFVFLHKPPAIEKWGNDFNEGKDEFIKLVVKYKVHTVFCGHMHSYDKKIIKGVQFIVTGGAGAPLDILEYDGYNKYAGNYYHILYVIVQGNQVLDILIKPNIKPLPYPKASLELDKEMQEKKKAAGEK